MLLRRIHSDTGLFEEVCFKPGINIILGVGDEKGGSNAVGKSTLVRLLDYALLSKSGQLTFDPAQTGMEFLKDESYSLEFSSHGREYAIERHFADTGRAWFGELGARLAEYPVSELRDLLGSKVLGVDDYPGYVDSSWFRTLMRFFIKDDMNHHERMDPINFVAPSARQAELLTYNLYLLGVPNRAVYEYSGQTTVLKRNADLYRELVAKLTSDTGKTLQELRTEVAQMRIRAAKTQQSLDAFKFLENYKDAETELVSINSEVTRILARYTEYSRRLAECQRSYENTPEIDQSEIAQLYTEVSETLGDAVKRTLDEVLSFRQQIADSRRRLMAAREAQLRGKLTKLSGSIAHLEDRRSSLLKFLNERKALDSVHHSYAELIEQKAALHEREALVSQISDVDKESASLKTELSKTVQSIMDEISGAENAIDALRRLYKEIVERAVRTKKPPDGAYFDIQARPDTRAPVKIIVHMPKEASYGKSRFKILAYDLMTFLNLVHTNRNLPRFLVHDGVFHGIDAVTRTSVLNYMHQEHQRYPDFQYIVSANEEELDIPSDRASKYGAYSFDWRSRIVAKYRGTPRGGIFHREFLK